MTMPKLTLPVARQKPVKKVENKHQISQRSYDMQSSLHVFASFGEQSDSKSREALDKQAPSKSKALRYSIGT